MYVFWSSSSSSSGGVSFVPMRKQNATRLRRGASPGCEFQSAQRRAHRDARFLLQEPELVRLHVVLRDRPARRVSARDRAGQGARRGRRREVVIRQVHPAGHALRGRVVVRVGPFDVRVVFGKHVVFLAVVRDVPHVVLVQVLALPVARARLVQQPQPGHGGRHDVCRRSAVERRTRPSRFENVVVERTQSCEPRKWRAAENGI
jgi:hypothetical protein